jgi:galactokinase
MNQEAFMSIDDDINAQLQRAIASYRKRYGKAPTSAAAAPGRVNLIGEHTDYNDGLVLPMAIQRQTVIVAGPASGPQKITFASSSLDEPAVLDLTKPPAPGKPSWANYVRGVIAGFQAKGVKLQGFNAMIDSTVPLGGGLSSSAALEVACATLLQAMTGLDLTGPDKALLCQKAEHAFAGTPCGIMDQFISTMAQKDHAMLLDCRTHETRMVPLTDPQIAVLIINSNIRHELSGGEYGQRRRQCEAAAGVLGVPALRDATMDQLEQAREKLDEVTFRRARHVITEIARTSQAASAAQANQWEAFGRLIYQSHASLRDDFEVSCQELDLLVELAGKMGKQAGVYGSRMTGGGFGGCTVSIVKASAAHFVQEKITRDYQARTGITPDAFVTSAAAGTHVLKIASVS